MLLSETRFKFEVIFMGFFQPITPLLLLGSARSMVLMPDNDYHNPIDKHPFDIIANNRHAFLVPTIAHRDETKVGPHIGLHAGRKGIGSISSLFVSCSCSIIDSFSTLLDLCWSGSIDF